MIIQVFNVAEHSLDGSTGNSTETHILPVSTIVLVSSFTWIDNNGKQSAIYTINKTPARTLFTISANGAKSGCYTGVAAQAAPPFNLTAGNAFATTVGFPVWSVKTVNLINRNELDKPGTELSQWDLKLGQLVVGDYAGGSTDSPPVACFFIGEFDKSNCT